MKSPAQKPIRIHAPQDGHTLVEMLIATIIGLFLILSVVGTFAWSMRNNMQDSSTARMQENARYALEAMSRELQMASFMHDASGGTSVDTGMVSGVISEAAGCGASGAGPWILKLASNELVSVSTTPETNFPCLTPKSDPDNPDSALPLHTIDIAGTAYADVFAVKRVREPESAPKDGDLYLQSNVDGNTRMMFWSVSNAGSDPAFSGASNWEFVANIFYIAQDNKNVKSLPECGDDFVPTLFRKVLTGSDAALSMETEPGGIAEGIEYFHLMWGIDNEMIDGNAATLPDGYPNYFVSAPTTAQLPGVVAAKLFVLARGNRSDGPYSDNKVYTMGDVTIPADTFSDCYHRKVFSTTVRLRNQVIKNVLSTVTS